MSGIPNEKNEEVINRENEIQTSEIKKKKSKLIYIPLICSGLAVISFIIIFIIGVIVQSIHPYLWIIIIFCHGIVFVGGALIYIIIINSMSYVKRKEYSNGKIACPNCNARNDPSSEFCSFCGYVLPKISTGTTESNN